MGEVYEAVHEPLSRKVALKTIRDEVRGDTAILARFRREAETAASLDHPNIVKVTDFQSLPNEPAFLVMEHLEGKVLGDVIEEERRLDPGRAAFIGLQILSGLTVAHRAGIVHRDIKPGNVFLQSTFAVRDLVKILDFGIAKLVVDFAATSRRALTDFGQILGTFAYMAPEQGRGGEVDARADIFAVGATLFHALSGVRPTEAMVPGHARVPLASLATWIDPRLAQVIDRAMERIPEMRFASAQEMADALAPFAHEQDAAPGSMTVPDGPDMRKLMEARSAEPTVAAASVIATPSDPIQPQEPIPATVAFGGTQPLAQPLRISQNPPAQAHSPSYPGAVPAPHPSAPRASFPGPAPSAPLPPISAPVLSSGPITSQTPSTASPWVPWLVGGLVVVTAVLALGIFMARAIYNHPSPGPATTAAPPPRR